jgi:hypothetical protein
MVNSGQVCIAVKRCYVPRSKYDVYIEAFKKAAATCKVGDGFEENVTMGPMNNQMQFDKVMDLINDAKANGAKVETGGEPLDQPGYFIPPTIFSNVSDGMRIVDEEQFGPVLPVIPYDTEEECLERITDTFRQTNRLVVDIATPKTAVESHLNLVALARPRKTYEPSRGESGPNRLRASIGGSGSYRGRVGADWTMFRLLLSWVPTDAHVEIAQPESAE